MTPDLIVPVRDLVGAPGNDRAFSGERPVRLRLGESVIDGPMTVDGLVVGMIDGVIAKFRASATAAPDLHPLPHGMGGNGDDRGGSGVRKGAR